VNIIQRLTKYLIKGMSPQELERVIGSHFGGTTTSAGVQVSSDTAMRQSTVYSCVNILSRVMGMIPCHLMQKTGDTRKPATGHSLYPLLHDMPNEWMTDCDYKKMRLNHLLLRGNFFALKNRGLSLTGPVRELIPLAPGIVTEVEQDKNYNLSYHCTFPDGQMKIIPRSEIIHSRGMISNGYMGINPIQYVREAVGFALAAEEFGSRYFGEGTHPGIIIEHPNKLKDPKALREALNDTYSGLGKAHRMMLLEEGMKAQKITIDPKDAQFLELRQMQKSEIVDIFFGMPLTLMSNGDKSPTFASAEQFGIGFVVYALLPWMVDEEKVIYRDLLTPEERKAGYYAKFQAAALQRGSFKDQSDGWATLIDKEVLNPNEVRELLDMNPYPGGDVYKTRTSTTKEPSKSEGVAS